MRLERFELTDDIVVLEGHVPRDCSEKIQSGDYNDEDHEPREMTREMTKGDTVPLLTDVLSKLRILS